MKLSITDKELESQVLNRHGPHDKHGWSPRLKTRFGYFSPDVYYEALLEKLIGSDTVWLDLGCGSAIFPSNIATAKQLTSRAKLVIGVDPSDNIHANNLVHVRIQGTLSDYQTSTKVDLITLRMVAEHVEDPESLIRQMESIISPGGRVVVYTVNYWSIVSFLSTVIPFRLHHPIKRLLWNTNEEDTFPVRYRMNTRRRLQALFQKRGFVEEDFLYLSDCRSFARWRVSHFVELCLWRFLKACRLTYPENCLLGVYLRR